MAMTALIPLLLNLLHRETIDNSRFLKLVADLNGLNQFENVAIFIASNVRYQPPEIDSFLYKLMEICQKPQLVITNMPGVELVDIINKNSLSIVFVDGYENTVLAAASENLRGFKVNKFIVVLTRPQQDIEFVQRAMFDAVKNQYISMLLIMQDVTNQTKVLAVDPYPNPRLMDKSGSLAENVFPQPTTDLKRYVVRTPVNYDMPRAFLYQVKKEMHMTGTAGRLFFNFISYMNMSFKIYPTKSSSFRPNMTEIIELVHSKEIEIAMHAVSYERIEGISISYPLSQVSWCLVVPVQNEIPTGEYIYLPFSRWTQYVIYFGLVYISAVLYIISIVRGKCMPVVMALMQSICLTYSLSHIGIANNPSGILFVLYTMLLLYGFILCNYYNARLASFLTAPVYGKQINSMQDLKESGVKIMLLHEQLPIILANTNYTENDFDYVFARDSDEYFNMIIGLNTSFAYPVTEDLWNFFNVQQQFLHYTRLRWTKICFGQYNLAFPMEYDSQLNEPLKRYIMLCQQGGLATVWKNHAFHHAMDMGLIKIWTDKFGIKPLDMAYYHEAWQLIVQGLAFCILVFFLEIAWVRIPWRRYK